MKNKINSIGIGNIGRVFGLMALLAVATVSPAFAESITKDFEFGAGTANSTSHRRTFYVPCGSSVSAAVAHYRLGDAGAANDVPIVIELRKPGTTADELGALADTQNATSKRTTQTANVTGTQSGLGCSLPWTVRVRPASGQSVNAIKGSIVLTYSNSVENISVEGGLISLNKGNSVTKNVGGAGGIGHGTVVITANWNHAIGPVIGPLAVKLKFELISPSGIVTTVSAYSSNEARSELTKFRLVRKVLDCESGQWKLKITNNTNDDTMNINPIVKYTPGCP